MHRGTEAAETSRDRVPEHPGAHRHAVFTFSTETWSDAVAREFVRPPDRLAVALLEHPDVDRLVVADAWRFAPTRLAPAAGRRAEAGFGEAGRRAGRQVATGRGDELAGNRRAVVAGPTGDRQAVLARPLRLLRTEPTGAGRHARQMRRYTAHLERAAGRLGLDRPAVLTCSPLVAAADLPWAGPVTYFARDDWATHPKVEAQWEAYRRSYVELSRRDRRVVAVSAELLDRIGPRGPYHRVVPNGIDPDTWTRPGPAPAWLAALPRPVAVYAGTVDRRLDLGLVQATLAALAGGTLVVIGPQPDPAVVAELRALSGVVAAGGGGGGQVVLVGEVAQAELSAAVHAADVGLIPHRETPLTQAMSPLKLYEYLASGRPVVCTDLPPVRGVAGPVALVPAGDGPAWERATRAALARGPVPEAERLEAIAEHSWATRTRAVLDVALAP